jgi:hypothetical protein
VAAAVLFGIGLAGIGLYPWTPRPAIQPPPQSVVRGPNFTRDASPRVARELTSLASSLHDLSRELAELGRRAELLDERRDAENLARRFDRFVALKNPLWSRRELTF